MLLRPTLGLLRTALGMTLPGRRLLLDF